jgi:hypothetical protein
MKPERKTPMSTLLELKTKILPGGRIEVQAPGFVEGQEVTVRIVAPDESSPEDGKIPEVLAELKKARLARAARGDAPKRRISDILADYPGGQLFKTAAEVDQYIKEERESWGD